MKNMKYLMFSYEVHEAGPSKILVKRKIHISHFLRRHPSKCKIEREGNQMEIWETASAKRDAGSKRWIAVAIIGKLYKNGKSKEEMKSEKLGGLRETVGAVPPTRDDQKQCNSLQM